MTRGTPLFRFDNRARSTSWMIALCTMFVVASFSVTAGLGTSMDALMDNFSPEYYAVTMDDGSGPALFQQAALSSVDDRAAYCIVAGVHAAPAGMEVVAFAVSDDGGVLGESLHAEGSEAYAGTALSLTGSLELSTDGSTAQVDIAGRFSSAKFSDGWLLCGWDTMSSLTSASEGECNLAVVKGMTADEVSALEAQGFVVQPTVSILSFLESGMDEIRTDTLLVLVPSAFVVGVLVYAFLEAEAADRRREIGILKTIGAGRRSIMRHLLASALAVTAWGAALGLALGIILSYGISTLASHMFTSVFVIEIQETTLALAFAATVAAGLVGTLLPAVRSTLSRPVDDLREGRSY